MTTDDRGEAGALDRRIAAAIDAYALDDVAFDALACDIFAYQLRWNAPYGAYARSLGWSEARLPRAAHDIPAVPAAAFKEAALTTAGEARAALWFETSGTTQGPGGRHYLETPALYERALLAGFDRALLADGARLRYALFVPDPRERPHSSLGFMMAAVARERGDGGERWYLHDDAIDVDAFVEDARGAIGAGVPLAIATTAFALVALIDGLDERGIRLALAPGSRVMETGGFKGRSRVVSREMLYRDASARLGVPIEAIVAEYGMTELSSQYYDALEGRASLRRIKVAPPWLRPIVVDPGGVPVPAGTVGAIRHIDCANRSSVVAVETEDLGALVPGGLLLLGREEGADLRGCSLDAETLLGRRAG